MDSVMRSHREKLNIDILDHTFLRRSQEKILHDRPILERYQNVKHFLKFFGLFSLDFFGQKYWSRRLTPKTWYNIWAILGLKKVFVPPKFCWNFSDFFSSNSEKNIIFRGRFSRKILRNDYDFWQFSTHPWYMRVCGKLRKLEKNEF